MVGSYVSARCGSACGDWTQLSAIFTVVSLGRGYWVSMQALEHGRRRVVDAVE